MTQDTQRQNMQGQTAKIYQFPVKARASNGNRQSSQKVMDLSSRLPHAEFGSGWYHDAAIQDAEPVRHR